MGGNEDAARLSGVSTAKVKLFVYVFCGILSGIAGILICSRITSGNGTVAEGYEMNAISAAVIGGVSMIGKCSWHGCRGNDFNDYSKQF